VWGITWPKVTIFQEKKEKWVEFLIFWPLVLACSRKNSLIKKKKTHLPF
jgi:hypothetical protein